jgi:hypothetical protein
VARVAARIDTWNELAILPLRDPEAERLLVDLDEAERFGTWHLAAPDGSLVGHGTGGRELLAAMRLTRPAGRLLRRVPDGVLEWAYEAVATHRSRLGRLVPDRPGPRIYP